MADFAADSFTDTPGAALETHAAETGGLWSKVGTASAVITAAGRARGNGTSNNGGYYSLGTPPGNDYDVQVDLYVASLANKAGLVIRGTSGSPNEPSWQFYYDGGTQTFNLVSWAASGGPFSSAQVGIALAQFSVNRIRLSARGQVLTCFLFDQQIIRVTASVNLSGNPGAFFSAQDTEVTGLHLDNFFAAVQIPDQLTYTPAAALYVGNDSPASISNLGLKVQGGNVNDALNMTAQLYLGDYQTTVGSPINLQYAAGSNGNYEGVLPYSLTLTLTPNTLYVVRFTGDCAGLHLDEWLAVIAQRRQ